MAAKKTFKLHDIGKQAVEVELIRGITQKQLVGWYHFQTWKETLKFNLQLQYEEVDHPFHKDPYVLKEIRVQSVDWFGNKIGFVKLRAVIENRLGKELPGVAFLRGGSVAMLMILRPKGSRDERWVVLTEQPRVPAGSLKFVEIPAGMIDEGAKTFGGVAAKEMKEETGLTIHKSELINLTELALQRSETTERTLQRAMYPSPGGSDEYIPIFLWEKELDRQEIVDLTGKLTGERRQGEMITLRVVRYEHLWKEGARDAKTLAAWALYEALTREGAIKKAQEEVEKRRRAEANNAPAPGTQSVDDDGEGYETESEDEDEDEDED